ncbi:MAG: hypothetical protein ACI857_002205 [Arenicella sp.]
MEVESHGLILVVFSENPKMKLVLIASCSILLFSCSDSYKDKLQGCWETVKMEHYLNEELQPESEYKVHWEFQNNFERDISPGEQADTNLVFSVTKDSIKFEEGPGFKYYFQSDSLVLEVFYDNEKECTSLYRIYLLKIDKAKFGDFSENLPGIQGDWEFHSSNPGHSDSLSTENEKESLIKRHDLYISEDSLYGINSTWELYDRSTYRIENDSLYILQGDETQVFHYELKEDTLIIAEKIDFDKVWLRIFVRADYDQGEIDYILENEIDPNLFTGIWSLYSSEEEIEQILIDLPNFEVIDHFVYPGKCWPNSEVEISWDKKIITIVKEGVESKMEYVFKFGNQYHGEFEAIFIPVVDGVKAKRGLAYGIGGGF